MQPGRNMCSILFKFVGRLSLTLGADSTDRFFLCLLAVVALQTAAQIVPHNIPHLIPSTSFKLIIHSNPVGQLTLLRRDHNHSESAEQIFETVDNI